MKLILASQSPRRKELLDQIGIEYDAIPAMTDEIIPIGCAYTEIPELLAEEKALAVSQEHPGRLVLGFDTLVFLGEKALGKPTDSEDARNMLEALSDSEHEVITGIALAYNGQILQKDKEITQVFFKKLNSEEIDNYIMSKEPLDKAGSYAIQEKGAIFVKKIVGCYYNIVGLPIYKTLEILKKHSEIGDG